MDSKPSVNLPSPGRTISKKLESGSLKSRGMSRGLGSDLFIDFTGSKSDQASGIRHDAAVSVALRKVEARRQRDPWFDRELGKIERAIS